MRITLRQLLGRLKDEKVLCKLFISVCVLVDVLLMLQFFCLLPTVPIEREWIKWRLWFEFPLSSSQKLQQPAVLKERRGDEGGA